MNKVTVAFGSFIVGILCGLLAFSLVQTSTRVQAFQQPPQAQAPPSVISMPGAVPVVPPLQFFGEGSTVGGAVQQLDGFSCERCTIAVPVFTYGGGAFRLPGSKVPRNVEIRLTGAAQNTFNLLRMTGAIPNPAPVAPPPGNAIQKTMLEIKAQSSPLDLVSLEGVKK